MKSNMSRVSPLAGDAALASDGRATSHRTPFQAADPRLRVLVLDDEAPARNPLAGSPKRIVARRKKSLVFLEPDEVWAFEATERLTFVHSRHGKFDLDLSLASIEEAFGALFTRVHRSWLVNAGCVRELERDAGETRLFVGAGVADAGAESGVHVPVARERAQSIRELLLSNATGLRRL